MVYEEAPVFKGIVKGKVNYVCRGMKPKVIGLDTDVDVKSDATAKQAQKYIDQFCDQQDYQAKRKERRRRLMIEGESFLWIEDPSELTESTYLKTGSTPTVCYVEPDFIRPSQKESTNQEDPSLGGPRGKPDWSFGIRTPHHQYWRPLEYQIVWNDNHETKVPVKDMVHNAVRERSNIKRCLPPAFCLLDDMIRLTLLRAALADASKFRAGIGGVVEYDEASEGAIRSWQEAVRGGGIRQDDTPPRIDAVTATNYTNLISLPPGRHWSKGPDYPDINSLDTIYKWHIQAIAQAEQMPEYMVSGAAAESSFASSLTSESGGIIEFEALQEAECLVDRRILKRILAAYIEKDLLPKDFFSRYDVMVDGESMISRDAKAETETAVMAVEAGFCSRQVAATNLGFDYQRDKPLIDEEREEDDNRAQDLGVNPMTGKPDVDPAKGSPQTMNGKRTQLEGSRS